MRKARLQFVKACAVELRNASLTPAGVIDVSRCDKAGAAPFRFRDELPPPCRTAFLR